MEVGARPGRTGFGRLVTGALAPAALTLLSACGPLERPPDLLLLTVETLRADEIGGDGHRAARTPTLDALRARGTSFSQAITPMPRTTPALGSLVTGLWPQAHGSREVGEAVTAGTTLAVVLRERGYRTLAVVANPSAGPEQGLDRGFDRFVSGHDLLERYGERVQRGPGSEAGERGFGWAEAVTREALDLVRGVPADEPVLLWVFYFDPHFSYSPPSPWRDRVEAPRCWELYERLHARPERTGRVFYDRGGVARRAVEDCRKLYRAAISYTDHETGRLLDGLDALGRLEGALTVFASDHGECFGEGGLYFEHGENVHDAALRVPLVVAGPGVAAGRTDRGSTSLVDVLPTLLSLLDVPRGDRPDMDGADLSVHLRPGGEPRGPDDRRVVFAESASALWTDGFDHVLTGRAGGLVCLNGPRYSLCEDTGETPGEYRLYDHRPDPDLTRDLARELPHVVDELQEHRKRWAPETARSRAARTPRFKLVETPRLDGGYERRLHDLESPGGEEVDVSPHHPRALAHLARALEAWAATIPRGGAHPRDPELEETLRSLGYLGR